MNFYDTHLLRVSRSFAKCITALEQPMRDWVSLSYLFCRVIDTVEDAPWENGSMQIKSFTQLQSFFEIYDTQNSDLSAQIQQWRLALPENLGQGEVQLISDLEELFIRLRGMPKAVRAVIYTLTKTMNLGMRYFAQSEHHANRRFKNIYELNRYCFFVAGIVGEALSQLLQIYNNGQKFSESYFVDAHHFGQFLQKVNILKDQQGDEQAGRFFVMSRNRVFLSMVDNAKGALEYILKTPLQNRGYRIFSLWSFFLGLKTLQQIAESPEVKRKIERTEALSLFSQIEEVACDNEKIGILFQHMTSSLTSFLNDTSLSASTLPFVTQPDWLLSIYSGELSHDGLRSIQVIN